MCSIATAFKLAAIAIIHMAATLIKCRASAAVQTVGQRETEVQWYNRTVGQIDRPDWQDIRADRESTWLAVFHSSSM